MDFHKESDFIQKSLMVVSKFGYLRKGFFWNYLTPNSRSTKFRNWKILQETGYLQAYKRSFIGEDVYKLSKRGKRILANAGITPVSSAHPLHFEHDDNVIQFALANEKCGHIGSNWQSEKVLRKTAPLDLTRIIGAKLDKLPDLIFDIPLLGQNLKVAFEIERTRKSQSRYLSFVNAYSRATGVQLVLVAYNDRSVCESIRKAARGASYPQAERPIAFCKIRDLHNSWTDFPIQISEQTLSFRNYIENLRELSESQDVQRPDIQSELESPYGLVMRCV